MNNPRKYLANITERLKGAIDSRIAEEQARQKALANVPLSRSSSSSSRAGNRKENPPKLKREKRQENGTGTQGPDPSEFEKEFVIDDDDDEIASKETNSDVAVKHVNITKESSSTPPEVDDNEYVDGKRNLPAPDSSLTSPGIRAKMRKLERLESKYQELLRSYRIAHARAISIEDFEKQLREYTPISTISDPDAFVEYMNQLKLKSDIVMEELKRVSSDRDDYKRRFEESKNQESLNPKSPGLLKLASDTTDIELAENTLFTPAISSLISSSEVSSGLEKDARTTTISNNHEEHCLDDNKTSIALSEIKEKTSQVKDLKSKVSDLEKELIDSKNKCSDLATNLEKVNHNLHKAEQSLSKDSSYQEKIDAQREEIQTLQKSVEISEEQILILKSNLLMQKREYEEKLTGIEINLAKCEQKSILIQKNSSITIQEAEACCEDLKREVELLKQTRDGDLHLVGKSSDDNYIISVKDTKKIKDAELQEKPTNMPKSNENHKGDIVTGSIKKKGKNKKKGGHFSHSTPIKTNSSEMDLNPLTKTNLEAEIIRLQSEITTQAAELHKFQKKRKTEEDLREEIENLQESLLNIGYEHVEAKEKIKELLDERRKLEQKIDGLENDLKISQIDSECTQNMKFAFQELSKNYEVLKINSDTFQTDLAAAQQLAFSRYKDLTDLKDVLHKLQPELIKLRAENADNKTVQEELISLSSELNRSEAREKDMGAEIASFKKQVADSQAEARNFHDKLSLENKARLRAEDQQRIAQRDLRKSEAEKIQYAAANEKSATEISRLQEEAGKLSTQVQELGEQLSVLKKETLRLRGELELRDSQYENAQLLLASMRDQVAEMAMQLKESEAQSESISEELSEMQRLLTERSREGETMRRLLADADGRAEAKIHELREKMDEALKERDRAEDNASTNGRRRARELDEVKTKLYDLEVDLQMVTAKKNELECAEREWMQKCCELEISTSNLSKEVEDIRAAMNQLRNALDESEKALKSAEKRGLDTRKALDETAQRYDKIQRENKKLQLKIAKTYEKTNNINLEKKNAKVAKSDTAMDYVYLKTIMLQFLEHKDRNIQESLVRTVLKQLLNFDNKEQERWIAAISTN